MMLRPSDRAALVEAARPLSRVAAGLLIVLSPFRARIELAARPSPPVYGDFTDLLVFWSDLALLATLALWMVDLALARRRPSIGPRFLAWPVLGLLAVSAIGVPFAVDPVLAAWSVGHLALFAAFALYVLNELEVADLGIPIAAMIAVQAVVAIGQSVARHSLGLDALGEYTLDPTLGVSVITSADGVRLLRGYGLADHPNILGGVLAFGLLLLPLARRSGDRLGLFASVFALGAVAILVTFSRAAVLGLGLGMAVLISMLLARGDRAAARRWVGAVGLAAVACAPFALADGPWLAARTDTSGVIATEARSIDEREALAAETNQLFIDHPLVGVGLGGLPLAMRAADPAFPFTYQPAHVVLLDVAAETGVIGAMLEAVLLVAPWLALVRVRERWSPELAAASGALAAMSFIGFFDYYTWTYPAGRIWSWLILGVWAVAYRRARTATTIRAVPAEPEGAVSA